MLNAEIQAAAVVEATRARPRLKDAGYRLNRIEVERMGRWQSLRRTATVVVLLALLALPPAAVTVGWLPSRSDTLEAETVARISLILETVLLVAVVLCAWRAEQLVRSARAPKPFGRLARGITATVVGLALLDGVENVLLWFVDEGRPLSWTVEFNVAAHLGLLLGLVAAGLVALLSSPGLWWDRSGVRRTQWPLPRFTRETASRWSGLEGAPLDKALTRWRGVLVMTEKELAVPPRPHGQIICCSGGGIRSAAFSLGGLQALGEAGIYRKARAVVGVSGGGYIAAAFHTLRWRSGGGFTEPLVPRPFDDRSPEMTWLRRHTRYLVESAKVATLGLLSLLYGIAVNLLWVLLVVAASAGWMALFLGMSGGLTGLDTATATGASYTGAWSWAGLLWVVGALGLVLFTLERIVDRLTTLPHAVREKWRSASVLLLWGGIGLTGLLIGIPVLIEQVHNWAAGSDHVLAGLAHQLGLVSTQVCNEQLALPGQGACGIASTEAAAQPPSRVALPASFATVVAAILAVVKAAQSTTAGGEAEGRKRLAKALTATWLKVRDSVIPWAAVIVIGIVVLVVELRWITSLVSDPGPLGAWDLTLGFAGVLIALRVLTDANRTSLHHFYRERLSYAYLLRRSGHRAEPLQYRETLRFSESAPPEGAGPELVACAIANVSDTEYVPTERHCTPFIFDARGIGLTDEALPSGPSLTASVIYERAADERARDATVAAAMAMSGAAFSPLAGRQNARVGPFRAVLALGNARLGVWLPNPLWIDDAVETRRLIERRIAADAIRACRYLTKEDRTELLGSLREVDLKWLAARIRETESATGQAQPGDQVVAVADPLLAAVRARLEKVQGDRAGSRARRVPWPGHLEPEPGDEPRWTVKAASFCRDICTKPGPFRFAKEAFGKTSVLDRKLYVTDGGHYDNLGLVEALRRRPEEVFVLDASSDPEDSFQALGDATATARIDLGVEIHLTLTKMVRGKEPFAKAAWTSGTATYPDGAVAKVHLIKVVMLEALPWDTVSYRRRHPEFPRTSTGNQLYGEFDLEAYRILGRELTRRLLEDRARARGRGARATRPPSPPRQRSSNRQKVPVTRH